MRWIKASERLPDKKGVLNSVIIRGKVCDLTGYEGSFTGSGPFVTYGFKNFSEENPQLYFILGNHSFLHNNVEWLDESESPSPVEVEAAAKEYADIKVPLGVKMYSQATQRVYKAFMAGYNFRANHLGEYQLCPKCNGDGHLMRYNSPPIISSADPICDVCNGNKIIQKPLGEDREGQDELWKAIRKELSTKECDCPYMSEAYEHLKENYHLIKKNP